MRKQITSFGSSRSLPSHSDAAAFTLVELMAVIFIIGLLAGLVVGVAGYANTKASKAQAMSEIEKFRNAFEEYRAEYGRVPVYTGEVTAAGFTAISNAIARYGIEISYLDPWGNSYRYSNETEFVYTIWSQGQDATIAHDDISNKKGEY